MHLPQKVEACPAVRRSGKTDLISCSGTVSGRVRAMQVYLWYCANLSRFI